MAKLYVTEFPFAGGNQNNAAQVGMLAFDGSNVSSVVDFSGGATASPVFNINTRIVRLHTDAICSVVFGTNPTATTSGMRLVAGQTEYFGVDGGVGMRVSAIANT